MRSITTLVFYTASILFLSCSPPVNYFETFVGVNQGVFRGLEMGYSAEKVKENEQAKPDNEDLNEYLHYYYDLGNNQQYTLEYSFDDNGLYEIEATIILTNKKDILELYSFIKKHYVQKYGEPKNEDDSGVVVWSVTSGNSQKTDITVMEDSERGELSISLIDSDVLLDI